ncbi:CopY/TcrY family copper transport repressor [Enterococcus haemoperoxidus ATCC BAA-382]|uniref:CopY/TcrY family copper transport repressor n=1 Tax=Enterococcus haemoperoxidus ATCC BAA-382 TaxID=1158608 RepID=R2SKK9_9ENTE|nr:CopY/TcrY family copper transport repressor [Enterococcus haemoperoxidus]EOH93371.1 CopY/TcrY family copper transport repressor [Enterococcus haemoperoxidus ATCC BAA-382]EOT61325.1 CopY/TcrY family copper transport repressor [Enterococcus haemoperoxidus ATCC BAA-382]OJG54507.1 CopY/TcrY family copper transport repressor [Enterococcus haemoperoxidus]
MSDNKKVLNITDAEWEVMRVAWATKETTSKEVTDILNEKTEWKSTTVKTLLSRLVDKGMLGTTRNGNKFTYFPLVEERKSIEALSKEMLTKVCSKKVGSVLESIIHDSILSFEDIDELEILLKEKRKSAVKEVPCNCVPGQCQCHLVS